jgi:dihydrofolate reductase
MDKKPIISLIAAVGKDRELGFKNDLIWKIPEDQEFFRKKTTGHPIIMGQKTFESIGRVLPNRLNIVLTRDENFHSDGIIICHSIDEALEEAMKSEPDEIFIIGGGQIYSQTIGRANRLYLTLVDQNSQADTYFPEYNSFKEKEEIKNGEFKGNKFRIVLFKN